MLRFVPLEAATTAEHEAIVLEIHKRAFEMVPCVSLGTFQIRTACRRDLTGVIEAAGPCFWNVRRV